MQVVKAGYTRGEALLQRHDANGQQCLHTADAMACSENGHDLLCDHAAMWSQRT